MEGAHSPPPDVCSLGQVPVAVAAGEDDAQLLSLLAAAHYQPLTAAEAERWVRWLHKWLAAALGESSHRGGGSGGVSGSEKADATAAAGVVSDTMRAANPKYVPREWMLAEAYEAAERGEYAPLRVLHEVLTSPYDEQPRHASRFYRRAPNGAEQQGGIGFMS